MAYFGSADEVYDTLGKLFVDVLSDPELGPAFRSADTIVRYEYSEPEAAITIRLREDAEGEVDFGESDMEPEVTMTMAADVAHRFWLGRVDPTIAMARGEIKAEGPVQKVLRLAPLAKPVFPRYKAQLTRQGRGALADL